MSAYALAIDLGASSGRHILGHMEGGRIVTTEIYRFSNEMVTRGQHLCWDADLLFDHIVKGLARCKELGTIPATVGIDTWGVDYALLDATGARIGDTVAYRDSRTEGMPEKLDATLSPDKLYAQTGIARQSYNTVYQLMANLASDPTLNGQSATLLFMPCYLSYQLTGVARNEYTIASTSGLLNAATRDWDAQTLQAAGIPTSLLGGTPVPPGTRLGSLRAELAQALGFNCEVILPACHDTGSAYLAVPTQDANTAILSSGTWSLLGMALDAPVLGEQARRAGFTNEGGYGGKIRFLRNIMGLWILQSIRKEWRERYTFVEMAALAVQGCAYTATLDVTDERFLAPQSMIGEINVALSQQGAPLPQNDAELLYCVHHSLALCYRDSIQSLAALTGQPITALNIVGGGCQNATLNQLTANATGLPVCAGPAEGTALGNLLAQWIATGELAGVEQARALLSHSIQPERYTPQR